MKLSLEVRDVVLDALCKLIATNGQHHRLISDATHHAVAQMQYVHNYALGREVDAWMLFHLNAYHESTEMDDLAEESWDTNTQRGRVHWDEVRHLCKTIHDEI